MKQTAQVEDGDELDWIDTYIRTPTVLNWTVPTHRRSQGCPGIQDPKGNVEPQRKQCAGRLAAKPAFPRLAHAVSLYGEGMGGGTHRLPICCFLIMDTGGGRLGVGFSGAWLTECTRDRFERAVWTTRWIDRVL